MKKSELLHSIVNRLNQLLEVDPEFARLLVTHAIKGNDLCLKYIRSSNTYMIREFVAVLDLLNDLLGQYPHKIIFIYNSFTKKGEFRIHNDKHYPLKGSIIWLGRNKIYSHKPYIFVRIDETNATIPIDILLEEVLNV